MKLKREELVKLVEQALLNSDNAVDYDQDKILVNFFDDEIFWDRIAEVAITTIEHRLNEVPWA